MPAPLFQHPLPTLDQTVRCHLPGFTISYDEVGSGEGIKRFLAGKVDFGASDTAMSDTEAQEAQHGVQFVPATAGMVVLAYNLPGVDQTLRLSREVYVDIFLGAIKMWSDPHCRPQPWDQAAPTEHHHCYPGRFLWHHLDL